MHLSISTIFFPFLILLPNLVLDFAWFFFWKQLTNPYIYENLFEFPILVNHIANCNLLTISFSLTITTNHLSCPCHNNWFIRLLKTILSNMATCTIIFTQTCKPSHRTFSHLPQNFVCPTTILFI